MAESCYLCGLEIHEILRPRVKSHPDVCKPCWVANTDEPVPVAEFDSDATTPVTHSLGHDVETWLRTLSGTAE